MTDNFELKRQTQPMRAGQLRSQQAANSVFEPTEHGLSMKTNSALVYCEGNFGALDGKTANGLVRHSEKYDVCGVIDSNLAGQDSGIVLDGVENSIPIYRNLADALNSMESTPDYFIFGMAPASGMLSSHERSLLIEAMSHGMDIVNGLHEFLNEDPVFIAACTVHNVSIIDVRKPRDKKDLRMFSGRIAEVTCPVIAVLGTDGAIGKRTTSTILTNALVARGIKAIMIGTGQTGLIQGARYGIAIDAIPAQFCSGEIEATIVEAFERENPDVIIVEGQGALSHPAYLTSAFILRGSQPDGVILQHAPGRHQLGDFPDTKMPTAKSEINLIETFSDTKVIGLTINHEKMTDDEVSAAIKTSSSELGIPATDALTRSTDFLVDMVISAFPALATKRAVNSH